MSFSVSGLRELEQKLNAFAKATGRAEARAVNRVATTIIAAQSRVVVEQLNVRVSRVKEAVQVSQRGTPGEPTIVIQVRSRPIGLAEFGGRWRGPKAEGAVAKVFKNEAAHVYAGTFVAVGRGGNRQIFERKRVGGKRAGRLPLRALYGPPVISQFKRDDVIDVGRETWKNRIPIELQREIAYALRQAGLK